METAPSIFYMTLPTENADEAVSLVEYLNQHGVLAAREGTEMVTCPMEHHSMAETVYNLHQSWRRFWEHSDSGLFGLPVYTKG
jgi:hypothetical protein